MLPSTRCFAITSVAAASERSLFHLEAKTDLSSLVSRECFNFSLYSRLEVRLLACRWRPRAVANALAAFPAEWVPEPHRQRSAAVPTDAAGRGPAARRAQNRTSITKGTF